MSAPGTDKTWRIPRAARTWIALQIEFHWSPLFIPTWNRIQLYRLVTSSSPTYLYWFFRPLVTLRDWMVSSWATLQTVHYSPSHHFAFYNNNISKMKDRKSPFPLVNCGTLQHWSESKYRLLWRAMGDSAWPVNKRTATIAADRGLAKTGRRKFYWQIKANYLFVQDVRSSLTYRNIVIEQLEGTPLFASLSPSPLVNPAALTSLKGKSGKWKFDEGAANGKKDIVLVVKWNFYSNNLDFGSAAYRWQIGCDSYLPKPFH